MNTHELKFNFKLCAFIESKSTSRTTILNGFLAKNSDSEALITER